MSHAITTNRRRPFVICFILFAAALPLEPPRAALAQDQISAALPQLAPDSATKVFQFVSDTRYAITVSALRVTEIALEPGEQVRGRIVTGDTVRWIVDVDKSDGAQQYIFIKPIAPSLSTNLIIRTNVRTYLLDVTSAPADAAYPTIVRWRYAGMKEASASEQAVLRSNLEVQLRGAKRDSEPVPA